MKKFALLCLLALLPTAAPAKDKPLPLEPAAAAALTGKTLVVTRHEKPSFVAMTAGKAAFAMFGAGAMIAEGNRIVAENSIADPASLIEAQLPAAIAAQYGMQLRPGPAPVIGAKKPKEIAASQTVADYVLDIRSGGWNFGYYPGDWNTYWVGYSVQVQLVDVKAGSLVSNLACNASTHKHAHSPSKDALLANGAQLLKDVTSGLGWMCVQLLAKEQFKMDEGRIAVTPAEYLDPLTRHANAGKAPVEGAAPTTVPVPPVEG